MFDWNGLKLDLDGQRGCWTYFQASISWLTNVKFGFTRQINEFLKRKLQTFCINSALLIRTLKP